MVHNRRVSITEGMTSQDLEKELQKLVPDLEGIPCGTICSWQYELQDIVINIHIWGELISSSMYILGCFSDEQCNQIIDHLLKAFPTIDINIVLKVLLSEAIERICRPTLDIGSEEVATFMERCAETASQDILQQWTKHQKQKAALGKRSTPQQNKKAQAKKRKIGLTQSTGDIIIKDVTDV